MRAATVLLIGVTIVGAAISTGAADDPRARAIMERVDARDTGDTVVSEMEMVLIDRRGHERLRKISSMTQKVGEDTRQVLFFLFPPDVEGTGFLTYDYDGSDRDDDQWLYLPALAKIKRIAASGKSGSFMGSDFNYSDLTSPELEDYDYTLVKESEVRGETVWVIEAVPRTRKVVDETGYEKSLMLIRQDNHVVVRAVMWVKGGEDLRYMDVRELDLVDGIWVATEIHMTTKRRKETRHSTILRLSNVAVNSPLSDDLFTLSRLERGP